MEYNLFDGMVWYDVMHIQDDYLYYPSHQFITIEDEVSTINF